MRKFPAEIDIGGVSPPARPQVRRENQAAVPDYLQRYYWWAYVRPWALKVFDHQWMVEAILWGNYARLRDAALDALGAGGRTLQVAAAYGDISVRLADRVAKAGGALDIIDALPIQIDNLRGKLTDFPVQTAVMDSTVLNFEDAVFDRALLFFLLHEQPLEVRRKTLAEALRVVKPGGRLVIVDYDRPRKLHPLRWLLPLVLASLEPFALDMWREPIAAFLPGSQATRMTRKGFFGGLFQIAIIERQ
jgi:ubiquinone/menaquinone biosynthesis C-methylase UbiE